MDFLRLLGGMGEARGKEGELRETTLVQEGKGEEDTRVSSPLGLHEKKEISWKD